MTLRAVALLCAGATACGGERAHGVDAGGDAPACGPLLEEPFDGLADAETRWALAAKGTGSAVAVEGGALVLTSTGQPEDAATSASATTLANHPLAGSEVVVDLELAVGGALGTFELAWRSDGGAHASLIAERGTLRAQHEDDAGVATALCGADCPGFGDGPWLLGLRQLDGEIELGAGHPADGVTYFARGPALSGELALDLVASAAIDGDRVDATIDGVLWTTCVAAP